MGVGCMLSPKQGMTQSEIIAYWEARDGEHQYLKEVCVWV
jgi:hypothetical protein